MKKKNFLIIILTVLVFLSAAVLGVATVYRVNEVTVDAATVSKAAKSEAQALQKELDEIYEKQSIFFVEQDLANEIVSRYPYFRITGFEKAYPNRLIVSVSEDEEVYALPCENSADGYYILGTDGTVLGVREDYNNRSDVTGEMKNVLITGLSVTGEKGGALSGDSALSYTLDFCGKLHELLGGIRRNILTVEVIKGGSAADTVTLRLTTFEGVKLYIRNPSLLTQEKAALAVEKYFALSDAQRTVGMIAVLDINGEPSAFYSAQDEFFETID